MRLTKKTIFSSLITAMSLIGIVAGVVLVQRRQVFEQRAAPSTALSFSASNSSPTVGNNISVNVNINTGSNSVIGSELYLQYDSDILQVTDVTSGSFLPNAQVQTKTIDNSTGRIVYILYIPTGTVPQTGSGTLATLSVTAQSVGSSQISFLANTIVAAVGEDVGQNVVASTSPITITVQSTATSTPIATATSSPASTNSPTPTTPAGSQATVTSSPTSTSAPGSNTASTNTPTSKFLSPTKKVTVTRKPGTSPQPSVTGEPIPTPTPIIENITDGIFPEKFEVMSGTLQSGDLVSLQTRNNEGIVLNSAKQKNLIDYIIGWVKGMSQTTEISFESSITPMPEIQYFGIFSTIITNQHTDVLIRVYNYAKERYDVVRTDTEGREIRFYMINLPGDYQDYVSPEGKIKVMIKGYSRKSFTFTVDNLQLVIK